MSLHYLLSSLKRPKKPPETKLAPALLPNPKVTKASGKPRPATLGASSSGGPSGWTA